MIEFIADLALETCVERLKEDEARPARFSLVWHPPLIVTLEKRNNDLYEFHLKRLDDPALINWGSLAKLTGHLTRLPFGATRVSFHIQLYWAGIIISQLLFILLTILVVLGWFSENIMSNLLAVSIIIGAIVINLLGFLFLVIYAQNQGKQLIARLQEKLACIAD